MLVFIAADDGPSLKRGSRARQYLTDISSVLVALTSRPIRATDRLHTDLSSAAGHIVPGALSPTEASTGSFAIEILVQP